MLLTSYEDITLNRKKQVFTENIFSLQQFRMSTNNEILFAKRLSEYLDNQGIKGTEFANLCEISVSSAYAIIKGKQSVTVKNLMKFISKQEGIDVNWLFTGVKENSNSETFEHRSLVKEDRSSYTKSNDMISLVEEVELLRSLNYYQKKEIQELKEKLKDYEQDQLKKKA